MHASFALTRIEDPTRFQGRNWSVIDSAPYLLEVPTAAAAVLVVRLVLVLPLGEVDLEPVLLRLVLQQPLPVGTLLLPVQRELDHAVAHRVFGLLQGNKQQMSTYRREYA